MVVGLAVERVPSRLAYRVSQCLHRTRPSPRKRVLGVYSPPSTSLAAVVKDVNLAEDASRLKRRRERLWASLPALSQNRAATYRLNSDALAIARTGVTYQDPRKMALLREAEVAADEAMRGVQREIRQLDE